MYPELFTIHFGDFLLAIKAYSFFYFLAIVIVIGGTYIFARKNSLEKKKLIVFLLSVSVSGLIGARILHWLTNWRAYDSGKYDIFSLDMEGFAISGGIVGALSVGFLVCRNLRIDVWKLGDTSVVFLGLGIALARIGCFLNGCCFGKITNLPWGVKFPELSQSHQYQLSHGLGSFFQTFPVHPTQLYEAGAALIGSILALIIIRKKYPPGVAIAAFGLWFAFFRLINSYFRVMPSTLIAPKYFYPALYVMVMLVCGWIIWIKLKNNINICMTNLKKSY